MAKLSAEDDEGELLAVAAAYLACEGRKQGEIAKTLGLSTAAVQRMLSKDGKSAEYLHIEPPRFLRERITAELMDKVHELTSRAELQKRIQHSAIRNNQVREARC